MSYTLKFKSQALKEFNKLSDEIANQFVNKLQERLENPRVPSAKLHNMKDCYKIKLRRVGYRLVYQVIDDHVIVEVVAVGKRDRNSVYSKAKSRL